MSETFYAWLAGFLDGDGCFTLAPRKKSYDPTIQIGQKNKAILEHIKTKIGKGSVVSNKQSYFYVLRGGKVVKFLLNKVLPYLYLKRKQGELLLEACRINRRRIYRNHSKTWLSHYSQKLLEIDRELKKLKKDQVKFP